jgi:predicted AAA+ superfamily ATPase
MIRIFRRKPEADLYQRHSKIDFGESSILLGPRGTGKSTLLKQRIDPEHALWIDLLLPTAEDRYARSPERLIREVNALPDSVTHVVIDEVQKVVPLLDIVHSLIESTSKTYILTGSSARKLKKESANLLAGRALVYHLFPLSSFELGGAFDLDQALKFGTLPKAWTAKSDAIRRKYLETYALTYLNEEIRSEQVVRNLAPFRRFLEVAAQMNGEVVNFSKIADDVGVDDKTVRSYFQALEDTLVGFFVEAYDTSVRRKIGKAPKFFFFDTGVKRALARQLTLDLAPSTSDYGDTFEHFIVLEIARLIDYSGNQFSMHHLRTSDNAEIDLVVDRPGKPTLLVEIKSATSVDDRFLNHLRNFSRDWNEPHECLLISRDPSPQMINGIICLPWKEALMRYFCGPDLSAALMNGAVASGLPR